MAFIAFMAGVPANAAPLQRDMKALKPLEKGRWELKERGNPDVRHLCLGDPLQLMQIGHGSRVPCDYYTVQDTEQRASVTYQCRNTGTGRTDLRVETPRLVQIETQGVANGYPFSLMIEARRVGACRPGNRP